MHPALLLPLATLALVASPLAATGWHDPAAIDRAVAAFVGAGIGQPGGAQAPVDRALRLAPCPDPLLVEWHDARRSAVRVTCPAANGWRVFVAVQATGPIEARAAPVINRRDRVRIEAGGAGFRISREGEALEDGRAGQTIRVRVDDGSRSGRIISGEVIGAGLVRVGTARGA